MPRFYCPTPLIPGESLELPAGAARHVQVLRLQPGDGITLFNGGPGLASSGGEFEATVTRMGRSDVQVQIDAHVPVEREASRAIHLVVGMPANDRMDWLVEKATELGVASLQPVMTERSVLRLSGERAEKKVAHWQSVAIAACEQCGGNRVPVIHEVMSLAAWTKARALTQVAQPTLAGQSLLLSLRTGTQSLRTVVSTLDQTTGNTFEAITFLSGPEGGLSANEEELALACGFAPVTLGPRVLRSETAALVALAALLV
ncbi:MAG: 16S rRNA (uracil(1498)-N(3))-methyltransferase [Rhodoferax sp.]|uniref:16S rRNA (uracil(1498)-N(3))-methyltransferase n=1 Tax=Rhodoferax sp. TaxID=50421 RepID=UPI00301B4391